MSNMLFLNAYSFILFLGLLCCMGFSLVAVSRGYSVIAVPELLIAGAPLTVEHGLSGTRALVEAARGVSSASSCALRHMGFGSGGMRA